MRNTDNWWVPNYLRVKGFWPAILWAILIFILTILPKDNIPQQPDWTFGLDKPVHFSMFGVLGFLVLSGAGNTGRVWRHSQILFVILMLFLYGVLMESLQYFLPDRSFSLADLLADLLGSIVGSLYFVKLKNHK